ncbi:hypothetical protein HYC85_031085 [Camellia sinensis]|uniref:Uncharacterized protein n=1 Tax=Camellia sinensis TaxID=4442 RepID=A0A7J7FPZ9_CAMSI|nr:hypothetical protein HYC85_031085 [Camellia sinensis]
MSLNILISFGEEYLLTIHCADHSVKPLDEWQLKPSLTDFLKSSFSLTVPEDDIVVHRFKDLKKRKHDDPVTHGALFIRDLGFLSKFSRSEILHGIDGEDDVKELEKKFLDRGRSVVGRTDRIELNLEVSESDDFGMTKEWEELNAICKRWEPDTIVLKGVPRRWFAEPRVSFKPSMLVTHTIFSTFGKIRVGLVDHPHPPPAVARGHRLVLQEHSADRQCKMPTSNISSADGFILCRWPHTTAGDNSTQPVMIPSVQGSSPEYDVSIYALAPRMRVSVAMTVCLTCG